MTLYLIISGIVQGVGYRQFIKKEALKRSLHGWVRNLPNGVVEAAFIGDKKILEEMIPRARKGSFLSEVRDIQIRWVEEDGKKEGFAIRYDF